MHWKAPDISLPTWRPDDPRIGHLLGRAIRGPEEAHALLIGFPSDEGVRRNGGRTGAAKAPTIIRQMFYRLTPDARVAEPFQQLIEHTWDMGDLQLSGSVEADQVLLGKAIAPYVQRNIRVFILGGGHETAFGHFLGYVYAHKQIAILNWDAHADVRPVLQEGAHSGSPFRQALEHPSACCQQYRVAGLLPHSVAEAHLEYLRQRQAKWWWSEELSKAEIQDIYTSVSYPTLVTFDLDAVAQAFAPGVSAPACGGMNERLWLFAAFQAGQCLQVTSVDIVEYNPLLDRDGMTARLAAVTLWQVFSGWAHRMIE